jgi:hypothetical protein
VFFFVVFLSLLPDLPFLASRIATILFIVHPVHVEAVASIVGRADCLCGLFFLSSISCYTLSNQKTGTISFLLLGSALFLAVIASLAKEIGVTGESSFFRQ